MITLDTTKSELRDKWKQMYRKRKKFKRELGDNVAGAASFSYFTGKMEYTAWLLINGNEVDSEQAHAGQEASE